MPTKPQYIPDCDIRKLIPYKGNPRRNDAAVDAVVKSIEAYGFVNPIVTNGNYEICAGHTRYKAAKQMGATSVPVLVVPDLTGDKFVGYNIADNQTGAISEWNDDELAAIIADLDKHEYDISTLGFDGNELYDILASLDGDGELADPDDAPMPPDDPITNLGDLWICGEHRILCGDATKQVDVDKLMGGMGATLMVTDPPYGVNYDPGWRNEVAAASHLNMETSRTGKVTNDDRVDWATACELFTGDVVYCWHADQYANTVADSLIRSHFVLRNQIIWVKLQGIISRGHYNHQHEPCWYAVRDGATAHWCGDHKQTTVWNIPSVMHNNDTKTNHGTQKPVECMARPIRNHKGDVYDPFIGSGTTMIACEQLNRKCYGMDIDPVYVDTAVKRWEQFTGKEAIRSAD